MTKISKCIHFEELDSTNTWAKRHSDQWDVNGITLITASEQTAGRGRFKRQWVSPPDVNLYASFCFWLNAQQSKILNIGHIPQILAISAAEVIDKQGFSSQIKWPNDLLLKGKKIGGILCETIVDQLGSHQEKRGIICGIGININMTQEQLNEIDRPAISLRVAADRIFDIAFILEQLKEHFDKHLRTFLNQGFESFFPLFQERMIFKPGEKITFHDHQGLIEAEFIQLNRDGSVELRLKDGAVKIFYAGEFL